MVCSYNEMLFGVKKNEVSICTITWMNLANVMVSEKSQSQIEILFI